MHEAIVFREIVDACRSAIALQIYRPKVKER
jgi:hypothetical protein